MDFAMPDRPTVLLVDNGSLQPAATLNLRRLAKALGDRVGRSVEPVSLLHSSTVDPALLGGVPAEILEPAIRRRHGQGARDFVIVPLFFGPSAALTAYIPERIQAMSASLAELEVRVAPPLVDPAMPDDTRLAAILAEQVCTTIATHGLERPAVILVDHGSPQPAVAAVRDQIGRQLAEVLDREVSSVVASSMERRDGAAYDFNEPLLARALERVSSDVVVAPLFFSPGRHAGPGGDIEEICRAAETTRSGLRAFLAPLVGEHPALVEILAQRLLGVLPGQKMC